MPQILETKSIYYDDVNLIAQPQRLIKSRADVPRKLDRFIVAPMSAVVGLSFTAEALRLGLQVCVPRFGSIQDVAAIALKTGNSYGLDSDEFRKTWFSVGLYDNERLIELQKLGVTHFLIDVANGYLDSVVQYTKSLQDKGLTVMVGNVHSRDGVALYGGAWIRVGIGNSAVCKTGNMTGYNRGQITEIFDTRYTYPVILDNNICKYASTYISYPSPPLSTVRNMIIADGGIYSPGCAAKAFGAGADYVMLGGYFSRAKEAQNVIDGEYKYWGGASLTQQIKQHGKKVRHSEGSEVSIDNNEIKPLEELVNDLWGGVSSAVSYSGFRSLNDFLGNGVFELKAR